MQLALYRATDCKGVHELVDELAVGNLLCRPLLARPGADDVAQQQEQRVLPECRPPGPEARCIGSDGRQMRSSLECGPPLPKGIPLL